MTVSSYSCMCSARANMELKMSEIKPHEHFKFEQERGPVSISAGCIKVLFCTVNEVAPCMLVWLLPGTTNRLTFF